MKIAAVLALAWLLIDLYVCYKWKRSLEQRERITRHAEKALAKAVKLQNEQIKLTQHLLNGQKLRYFAMNKQTEEIEQSLEEVKRIASGFNGAGKGSGRNLKK